MRLKVCTAVIATAAMLGCQKSETPAPAATEPMPVAAPVPPPSPPVTKALRTCLVVGITDGDTLKARCGAPGAYQQIKVRLSEIDAPESRQPFGQRSRQQLSNLCYMKQAELRDESKDRYGRTVARVTCNGTDANAEMVKAGMAWSYTQYSKDLSIPELERQARASRAGLWADSSPVAPWEWRRTGKSAAPVKAAASSLGGSSRPHAAAAHAAPHHPTAATPRSFGGATCYTGPRGGTYTITASGRKNYNGC